MTLFTESGLNGQELPSPMERVRRQVADCAGVGASCAVPTPCCLLDVAIVPFRQEQALTA
ncbi:MAG: hypothetical protein QOJ56_5194 [Mycobacterium sp.]|nr:hypothetical protein [Mycobacterium sp.]